MGVLGTKFRRAGVSWGPKLLLVELPFRDD